MEKEQFLKFKEDLKREAQEQKELKNQRKTIRLNGGRTIDPYQAAEKVRDNGYHLDKKYVIYYILKHRIEVTEKNKEDILWDIYAKLHSQYKNNNTCRTHNIGLHFPCVCFHKLECIK